MPKSGNMYTNSLPLLPNDTSIAAKAVFSKKNVFVKIGDLANKIFTDIDLSDLYPEQGVPKEFPYLHSLALIFQYNEKITDQQAAEATRVQTDWKYALHISMTNPGLGASSFCDFRRRLFVSEAHKAELNRVLERLKETKSQPWESVHSVDAETILQSVCTRNRLDFVASTMQSAVQVIGMLQPDWLRRVIRPHWLVRYSQTLSAFHLPDDWESQVKLAESIGEDGLYLLHAVARGECASLVELAEIQALRNAWDQEYDYTGDHCVWRVNDCTNCLKKKAGKRAIPFEGFRVPVATSV